MASTVRWQRLRTRNIIQFGLLVLTLIISVVGASQLKVVREFFGFARYVPANLVVDTQALIGPLPRPWRNLAQGGESFNWQISPIQAKVAALSPDYIRLDHIYDFYDIVGGSPGNLTFDFSKFDVVLDQIAATGAKPFISLSYMPPVIADGDIVSAPKNYSDWSLVVQKTIEHVSGTRNTADVYYEVWNEPDLFGGWKYYGSKNYLELYRAAAVGAARARVGQNYKFGGPAITALYKNWFDAMAKFTAENNLRYDFFSWHRYSTDVNQYLDDMFQAQEWLAQYPVHEPTLELLITEWGHDSENDPGYDTTYGAAHSVAGAINMVGVIDRAFVFEIQDGVGPAGQESWGRWGLITAPGTSQKVKPRYRALQMLDSLPVQRVQLTGKGSNVKALAGRNLDGTIEIVAANFDPQGRQSENVPLTFENITPGEYQVQLQYLSGRQNTQKVATTEAILQTVIPMAASDVVKIKFGL